MHSLARRTRLGGLPAYHSGQYRLRAVGAECPIGQGEELVLPRGRRGCACPYLLQTSRVLLLADAIEGSAQIVCGMIHRG